MRGGVKSKILAGVLLSMLIALPDIAFATSQSPQLSDARRDYADALRAIRNGQWQSYEKLRSTLDDYPLALYLDYYDLSANIDSVDAGQAQRFLRKSADSPLAKRFLSNYLRKAGQQRRWSRWLAVMPQEPNTVELKCYYFRAQLAQGNPELAYTGAKQLWLYGKSQAKACDPLFTQWTKSGGLTDALVWARMRLAFAERQGSLMRFISRSGSDELGPWSKKLLQVYRDPSKLDTFGLPVEHIRTRQLVASALINFARYSPEQALNAWDDYRTKMVFDAQQRRDVEYAIALRGLFAKADGLRDWFPVALARLSDDKLLGIRLRWALAEEDWASFEHALTLLSPEERAKAGWRYWQSVALFATGKSKAATKLLQVLAKDRGFYSFLAADALGKDYAFNPSMPVVLEDAATLKALPAVRRVGELRFHEELAHAHSEWAKVLADVEHPERQVALAQLAYNEGWHRMAIDAANRARAWDALALRFPTPYHEVFTQYADMHKVPRTALMAIARRESAFYPGARSSAGARGLMQIMPATGAQVAKRIGEPHQRSDLYEVEHNVRLGSAYYKQLLERYDDNRVYALAAYNAGPHRVDRWRNKGDEKVPIDVWVETIPFKETREYVQAVLAYNVVFQYRLGDNQRLLSAKERKARY